MGRGMFDTARDGLDVDAPFHAVPQATTSSVGVGANALYSSHLPSEQVVVGARQFDGRDLSALTTNQGGSTRAAPTYAGSCLNGSSGGLTPGAASCSPSIRRSGDSGLNSWRPMGEPVPSAPLAAVGTGRADYLYLGHFAGWPYLVHAGTGRPFHVRAGDGLARPASDRELDDLEAARAVTRIVPVRHGGASLPGETSHSEVGQAAAFEAGIEKTLLQVLMLDDADVPNGFKAISIFLFENWTGSLLERFGPHDSPHTISNWRATRGSPGSRNATNMVRLSGRVPRKPRGDGTAREALQRHAFDVVRSGAAVRTILAAYSAEIVALNDARNAHHGSSDPLCRIVSESTMQRRVRYLRSFARLADSQDKVGHPAAIKRSHESGGDVPDANTSSGFSGRGAQ